MSFVSYAQNFEDVLLHRVFGGQETGFYVDAGAFHPVVGSVTKSFYDRGWSGINIEPGSVFAELAAARPRDVNLNMALLDHAGEIAFVEDSRDRGTSRIVLDSNGAAADARTVPCDTLEAVVRAHAHGRPVDFIKVDVEGAEGAIVRSTDWRRLRPRVLLLEATLPWSSTLANQDWEPVLLQQGYVRAYFDGLNCFYVPEEEPALLRCFQAPVNVLDRAVRHEDAVLRGALDSEQAETARLAAERAALEAALDAQRAEAARLAAARDALSAALEAQRTEAARALAERDALRAASGQQQQEVARLAAERDALRGEAGRLAHALQDLQARLGPPAGAGAGAESGAEAGAEAEAPTRSLSRRVARRAARSAYRLVRPVARPLAWRLRAFMVAGLTQPLTEQLTHQLQDLTREVRDQGARAHLPPAPAISIRDDGAAAELRRLADEMERALLTLAMDQRAMDQRAMEQGAMERPRDVAGPAAELQETGSHPRVTLLLPHGRTAEVACAASDLSVSAALRASGGDWEPHVRRYLEGLVQPPFVCFDIGANLGAHALSLAVLAESGRVVAFEADAANFALLSQNAAALARPCAAIEPVHVALWDGPGRLISGGADELAGCSFVAEGAADAALVEQRLRAVVDADAISGVDLHMRLSEVAALTLDSWVAANPLARLDVIKLDVEGAEARVIRGADATLRQYRPVLLVEYNPACAAAYFGQEADALFRELETRFAAIHALEPDGALSHLADWEALRTRLAAGKGWEDLVCLP